MGKRAVVLLSGGLDSATTLYLAKEKGYKCLCLIFDYGQRHKREINAAKRIAQTANCKSQIVRITLPWKGSSLLDKYLRIPERHNAITQKHNNSIPSTYVPARNIIFLSFALSCAEVIGAETIFIGAHIQDCPDYPDCRPEFFQAFKNVIIKGTKTGVEKKKIELKTPLIHKTKAQIIKLGRNLGVPFELTWSCYRGGRIPCGRCDSCLFRAKGFKEARIRDPLLAGTEGLSRDNIRVACEKI